MQYNDYTKDLKGHHKMNACMKVAIMKSMVELNALSSPPMLSSWLSLLDLKWGTIPCLYTSPKHFGVQNSEQADTGKYFSLNYDDH